MVQGWACNGRSFFEDGIDLSCCSITESRPRCLSERMEGERLPEDSLGTPFYYYPFDRRSLARKGLYYRLGSPYSPSFRSRRLQFERFHELTPESDIGRL